MKIVFGRPLVLGSLRETTTTAVRGQGSERRAPRLKAPLVSAGVVKRLNARLGPQEGSLVEQAQEHLEYHLLPSKQLPTAVERVAASHPGAGPEHVLAQAITLMLASPNALAATTWAPVAVGRTQQALLTHYLAKGLLKLAANGDFYALVRDPSFDGDAPMHNRALGLGNAMIKGVGVAVAPSFELPGGGRIRAAVFNDAKAKSMHRLKGALSAEQADDFASPAFTALSGQIAANLKKPGALRALAQKHRLSQEIVPHRVLTLGLQAVPVQALDEAAKKTLRALPGALMTLPKSVTGNRPDLFWVKPAVLFKLASNGSPIEAPPLLAVHLYTANSPAVRNESLAASAGSKTMLTEKGSPSVPKLSWSRPLSTAAAAVAIGYWQPFFEPYGWQLRQVEGGELRVFELETNKPIVVEGSAEHGALAAAQVVHEGSDVISGLVLRSLWQKGLSSTAAAGGTPFQGRNTNPRARLDWDTLGSAVGERMVQGELRTLRPSQARKYELGFELDDPTRLRLTSTRDGSPLRNSMHLWRNLGLPLGPEVLESERRSPYLMARIAHGVSLRRYLTGPEALPLPTS